MATAATKLMTAAEFYDFVHRPENTGRFFELERGEVIELPPPRKVHGFVCANVVHVLNAYSIKVEAGYVCCNDTGVIVAQNPDTVRGVDVCYYLDDENIDTMERRYSADPPRLAVEVLSPTDRPERVIRRISEYLRCGVALVWIVDAENRLVTTYRKGREQQQFAEDDVLTGETVLRGLEVPVAELFVAPGGRHAERRKSPRRNGNGKAKGKKRK